MEVAGFWLEHHWVIFLVVVGGGIVLGLWWADARKMRSWGAAGFLLVQFLLAGGIGVGVAVGAKILLNKEW